MCVFEAGVDGSPFYREKNITANLWQYIYLYTTCNTKRQAHTEYFDGVNMDSVVVVCVLSIDITHIHIISTFNKLNVHRPNNTYIQIFVLYLVCVVVGAEACPLIWWYRLHSYHQIDVVHFHSLVFFLVRVFYLPTLLALPNLFSVVVLLFG